MKNRSVCRWRRLATQIPRLPAAAVRFAAELRYAIRIHCNGLVIIRLLTVLLAAVIRARPAVLAMTGLVAAERIILSALLVPRLPARQPPGLAAQLAVRGHGLLRPPVITAIRLLYAAVPMYHVPPLKQPLQASHARITAAAVPVK